MTDFLLETPRLLFRPHQPADLEPYCAMEMDPEVRRYVGGYPRTREAAEAKFRNALHAAPLRLSLWATILKSEARTIGRCGLYPHIDNHRTVPNEAVLAFYLARPFWGKGLATEAATAFISFGFDELHLSRIVATVDSRNTASLHILAKLNFTLTGTEPGPRTFLHFELLRPA
jgi:ribosomal-protein-alanine N-acetyltransferase